MSAKIEIEKYKEWCRENNMKENSEASLSQYLNLKNDSKLSWDKIEEQLPKYLNSNQKEAIKAAYQLNKKIYLSGFKNTGKTYLTNLLTEIGIKCQEIDYNDLILLTNEVDINV